VRATGRLCVQAAYRKASLLGAARSGGPSFQRGSRMGQIKRKIMKNRPRETKSKKKEGSTRKRVERTQKKEKGVGGRKAKKTNENQEKENSHKT